MRFITSTCAFAFFSFLKLRIVYSLLPPTGLERLRSSIPYRGKILITTSQFATVDEQHKDDDDGNQVLDKAAKALYGSDEDNSDDDNSGKDDTLTHWQITACLRNRKERENNIGMKIDLEEVVLKSRIEEIEKKIEFMLLAEKCFIRYIKGYDLEDLVFYHEDDVSLIETLDMHPKNQELFNDTLKFYGFSFANVTTLTVDGKDKKHMELSLIDYMGTKTNGTIENMVEKIQSVDKEESINSLTRRKATDVAEIEVSKTARRRKVKQEEDIESLRDDIKQAEKCIVMGKWRRRYMKLASEIFVEYYKSGELRRVVPEDDRYFGDLKLLLKQKKQGVAGYSFDRELLFNECLSMQGLYCIAIKGISDHWEPERLVLELGFLSENFEGAEGLHL